MTYATDIIRKFGGPSAMASLLGCSASAVRNWSDPDRGIPARYHLRLLRLARERGIALSEDELLNAREPLREVS